MKNNVLAYDFGASSGRAMLGTLEDGKIKEYSKDDIEMLDGEVDIEINTAQNALDYHDEGETLDLKSLDNDKNSSTGNI